MYINNVRRREECQHEAAQDLRKLGIKCRPKKPKPKQTVKRCHKLFKVPLEALPKQTVTLTTGQQISVPKLVHELCSFILTKADTEGIFRKEGSRCRQNEIKLTLSAGGPLEEDHHVIDIAAVLKTFLRELPEPLIPFGFHELFLRCVLLEKNKLEAILLACLLLPMEHLNSLSYLLQFLKQISDYSKFNKMNAYNLAVVMGPNVFPIEEKLSPNIKIRTVKTCELFQILIENASSVGFIPDNIIERIGNSAGGSGGQNDEIDKKKKKRRSGSLTRMFNGLKKIVAGKSADEPQIVTPDLLMTPLNQSNKKKRPANGISTKKRKDLVSGLPDNVLLNTPFTPCRTPISMELSGPQREFLKEAVEVVKEKKPQWFSRSRSVKNLKQESEAPTIQPKSGLERRWSAISHVTNLKKLKKRSSCTIPQLPPPPSSLSEPDDYIRVPKTEYEAIKNRVSAMERRISIEIETQSLQTHQSELNDVKSVQTAYEQTRILAENLSPGTDQLAKRLSRELRIRRSGSQKVIRSPSARKIGSMRRRSREIEKNNSKLSRHQSWHVSTSSSRSSSTPKTALVSIPVACNLSGSSCDTWVSAEGFFTAAERKSSNLTSDSGSSAMNDRASIAKLRSQNAGMVMAKAKLFDQMKDSDSSSQTSRSSVRNRRNYNYNYSCQNINNNKIGAVRNNDARMSYRVRALKYEEKRMKKSSVSPRRRCVVVNATSSQRQKIQMASKQYILERSSDKENISGGGCVNSPKFAGTAKVTPHIKRQLNVKSPKRLCRTPVGVERSTPLRVLKTPIHNYV